MADFTLNAPGTTNNPWTPANVIIPVGTIKSDATGWRAGGAGVPACFAHNVVYGSVITSTFTLAAGAASNGDDLLLGIVVRSGTNAGAGIGLVLGISTVKLASWDKTLTETNISAAGLSITRGNSDVWTITVTFAAGTFTITNVTQNGGGALTFSGTTTTALAAETTLAAGGGFEPFNNDSLYLAQFTGTGVAAGVTISAPTPSGTLSTATTVSLGCTTTASSGTLYGVIDTAGNISGITAAQVIAAQNNAGGAAAFSGNVAVSGSTPSLALTGLTPNTTYSYALAQVSGSNSNVLTGSFTTSYVTTPYTQTQFFVTDRVVQF